MKYIVQRNHPDNQIEYDIPRDKWEPCEARTENDIYLWCDKATGYLCLIIRYRHQGHLSGYVGVSKEHPLYGWKGDPKMVKLDGLSVHNAIGFYNETSVPLHKMFDLPVPDATTWFGPRFNQYTNMRPAKDDSYKGEPLFYRNVNDVQKELKKLAGKLYDIAEWGLIPEKKLLKEGFRLHTSNDLYKDYYKHEERISYTLTLHSVKTGSLFTVLDINDAICYSGFPIEWKTLKTIMIANSK